MTTEYTQDTPYGAWVTPTGSFLIVVDECSHYSVISHTQAFNEGYIRVVYPRNASQSMCLELHRSTVTLAALKAVTAQWRDRGILSMEVDERDTGETLVSATETPEKVLSALRKLRGFIIERDEQAALVPKECVQA